MSYVAKLTGVELFYGSTPVLRSVDLEVNRGEILALIGPSGAGKSSLLQILNGQLTPQRGEVLRPEDSGGTTRTVFQQPHLLPWRTAAQNVRLGLEFTQNQSGVSDHDLDQKVGSLLTQLGLAHLAHRFPAELSGGQAGRVAVARAIATGPSLLLLDEPFGALDPTTRRDLQDWLIEVSESLNLATVVVTHDLEEALLLGDRIGLLHAEPGPIDFLNSPVKTRADLADGSARRALLDRFDSLSEQRELLASGGSEFSSDDDGAAPAAQESDPAELVRTPKEKVQATRREFLTLAGTTGLLAVPFLVNAFSSTQANNRGNVAVADPGSVNGGDPATPKGSLRIGYLPITDAAPLLLAHDYGEFAARGIETPEPTLYRGWAPLVEALQGDAVDIVHLLMPLAVQLRFEAKVPIKVLSWNHTNGSALVTSKNITEVSQLAGTTVAIPAWYSIHNVVLQKLFATSGLRAVINEAPETSAGTVQLVVVPPADMPASLESGSIAGYIVAEPFCAVAEVQGIGHVLRFTGDVWKDHACCVTVVRESLLTENPELAQAAADAIVATQLAIREDRNRAAQRLSEGGYLPQPLPAIQATLAEHPEEHYLESGAIAHPEWDSKRIDFQPYPFPSYTAELVEAMRSTVVDSATGWLENLDSHSVHADLVATGISANAINAAGGLSAFGSTGYRTEVIAP